MFPKTFKKTKSNRPFLWIGFLRKWFRTRYWFMQQWTFLIVPHTQWFWYRVYFPKENIKWEIAHKNQINIVTRFTLSLVLKRKYLIENVFGKSKLMKVFIKGIK